MEIIAGLAENPYLANTLQLFMNPTPYFLAVVFVFLVIFFYGMNAGRGKAIIGLVSLYPAIILTNLFPYEERLLQNFNVAEPFFFKAGLFVVAVIISFILFLRSPLRSLALHERKKSPLFQVLILSVIILGIFASYITTVLPEEKLAELTHPVFDYFKTENAQFWWALAGVVFLAMLRRRE